MRIGTITLDRDGLCFGIKSGADPGIFQTGSSMPLSLAFKAEGSTIDFQSGEGPLLDFKWGVHFQNAFIYIVSCSNGEKKGGGVRPTSYWRMS